MCQGADVQGRPSHRVDECINMDFGMSFLVAGFRRHLSNRGKSVGGENS